VNDPYTFGRIAAANAISDVYAMGGKPITALNLVFFPACTLAAEVLREILDGGISVLKEAGVTLLGGHTVEDDELKYGLSVTGLIDPEKIVRNSTARPGDVLVLTKPLGTGIISTAIKGDAAPEAAADEAIRWMTTLNRDAASLMRECGCTAATDVTGFGLLGHATEMTRGAHVTLSLKIDAIPLMRGVNELIADGMVPAGCYRNRDHFSAGVATPLLRSECHDQLLPLYDPQTSGGLLIALPQEHVDLFMSQAKERGIYACKVGSVLPIGPRPIVIY